DHRPSHAGRGRLSCRLHRMERTRSELTSAVLLVVVAAALSSQAGANHVGAYVPKDNAVTTNFKQVKFSVQAKKFDVPLQLFEAGALRAEMLAHAATLPARLEESTRAALKVGEGAELERRLMFLFAALARD